VRDIDIGRIVRVLRRRRGWRQLEAAAHAGVHRSTWSLVERGHLDHLSMTTVRRCLEALECRLDLVPRWRGAELDRLLDEAHSRLQAAWSAKLELWGWEVLAEVSFNHYGERGRVDLLAFHRALRNLVVVEIKSELADVQGLLGPLDVKTRVATSIAGERGWGRPIHVAPVLIIRESATSRRRLAALAPLFGRFNLRGRGAISWLRKPSESPSPLGLLILSDLSPAGSISAKRVGTQRVRVHGGRLSAADADGRRDGSAGRA
jgi:transcriptional regulator with XRE-family HTH domain